MKKHIISFDGTEKNQINFEQPDRYKDLFKHLLSTNKIIAIGAGLSYCNAGAGENVTSISTKYFNRILEFDIINGIITVEPGLAVGDFLNLIVSKGWYFPVLPGYPLITIGGCVAFNVHGKSQYNVGNFCDFVLELNVFHPKYGEVRCSITENRDLFELTLGGMGFTGYITSVKLKLSVLEGVSLIRHKKKVENLIDAAHLLQSLSLGANIIYSWNNLNKKGSNFGKGIIFAELFENKHIMGGNKNFKVFNSKERSSFGINLLNKITTPMMCNVFYLKELITSSEEKTSLINGSFPIMGKEIYFKLFGTKGLREYQMIIPFSNWEKFVNQLQKLINKQKIAISLGSLKLFSGEKKYLNFTGSGICLAIDVPATKESLDFF